MDSDIIVTASYRDDDIDVNDFPEMITLIGNGLPSTWEIGNEESLQCPRCNTDMDLLLLRDGAYNFFCPICESEAFEEGRISPCWKDFGF